MKSFFTFLSIFTTSHSFGQTTVNYREIGMTYISSGKYDEGIMYFNNALKNNPKNEDILRWLGYANLVKNNLEAGEKYYLEASLINPDCDICFLNIARVKSLRGDHDKAIIGFTRAIAINRNNFSFYLNRATSYYALENLDASCADYLMAQSLLEKNNISDPVIDKQINATIQDICDPSKPSYYYQRGVAFYNLKEYQKAVDIYAKGLSNSSNNSMMLSFQGNAFVALNEYEKAIDSYQLSLKNKENLINEIAINPRFSGGSKEQIMSFYEGSLASTYYSLAECELNLGYFEKSLNSINTALQLAPNIEEFRLETYYNLRGNIYLMTGNFEKAISDFDKSIHLNKNFPLAYVNRAIAKASLSEKVKIRSYSIRGKINNQPLEVSLNTDNKAASKKSETNLQSAFKDYNTAIEIESSLGFAYYIRGQIKLLLKKKDYCKDLVKAEELGLFVDQELFANCIK